jgi:CRP/FNR family transcriptional regulator
MDAALAERLGAHFPSLATLPATLAADFATQVQALRVSSGTVLFEPGAPCQAFPLILEGAVRVSRGAPNGREIRLYRLEPGEICIVTTSCMLGADAYPARGVVERELLAAALPRPLFMRLVEEHPAFRQQVFHLFADRLSGLMALVEEVAFRQLDARLAALLAARAPLLRTTHQALADELGSVREIVSRLLRQFEEQGWVRLGREQVEVLDRSALEKLRHVT